MVGPQWIVRKRRLKAWALAHGVPIPKGFRISPACGAPCRELIKRVEAKAWGPEAATRTWDGRLTAPFAPKGTLGQKQVRTDKTQVGVKLPGLFAGVVRIPMWPAVPSVCQSKQTRSPARALPELTM